MWRSTRRMSLRFPVQERAAIMDWAYFAAYLDAQQRRIRGPATIEVRTHAVNVDGAPLGMRRLYIDMADVLDPRRVWLWVYELWLDFVGVRDMQVYAVNPQPTQPIQSDVVVSHLLVGMDVIDGSHPVFVHTECRISAWSNCSSDWHSGSPVSWCRWWTGDFLADWSIKVCTGTHQTNLCETWLPWVVSSWAKVCRHTGWALLRTYDPLQIQWVLPNGAWRFCWVHGGVMVWDQWGLASNCPREYNSKWWRQWRWRYGCNGNDAEFGEPT